MKPIANQKIVSINKETVEKGSGKKRQYFLAYVDTIEKAAKELKGNAFKVYVYLITNQNDFTFGLSPQDISNSYGMSIDTAREGINSLIDKGFLVLNEGTKNEYTFYDKKDRKPMILPEEVGKKLEKKVFVNRTTGEKVEYTFQQILDLVKDEAYAKEIWEGNNQ